MAGKQVQRRSICKLNPAETAILVNATAQLPISHKAKKKLVSRMAQKIEVKKGRKNQSSKSRSPCLSKTAETKKSGLGVNHSPPCPCGRGIFYLKKFLA